MTDRVERFDLGGFRSKPTRTPQGFLRMTGNLTRTGVLTYKTKDGKTIRELRHPEDVFAEDSLRSLSDAPVTDLHPSAMVTDVNCTEHLRGTVRSVEPVGKFVTGELIVQDAKLISKITSGSRRELSPGYTCSLEWGAGEYNGEKYDARQRNIVYNHLALGPQGWGRSGPEVSVHMDSAATEIGIYEEQEMIKKDNTESAKAEEAAPEATETTEMPAVEVESPEQSEEKPADPAEPAQKTDDSVRSEIEVLKAEKDALQAKLDAANEFLKSEHFRAAVAKRVALEVSARKVLGDVRLDHLDDVAVYTAALSARGVKVEGKTGAYIEARFDAMVDNASADSIREVRTDSTRVIEKEDPRAKLVKQMNSGANLRAVK